MIDSRRRTFKSGDVARSTARVHQVDERVGCESGLDGALLCLSVTAAERCPGNLGLIEIYAYGEKSTAVLGLPSSRTNHPPINCWGYANSTGMPRHHAFPAEAPGRACLRLSSAIGLGKMWNVTNLAIKSLCICGRQCYLNGAQIAADKSKL